MRIFFFRSHSTADMTLGLVDVQHLSGLTGQCGIHLLQPFGHVLMYGRFRYAKMTGCLSYGCVIFNNIVSDFHYPLFNISFQKNTPALSVCTVYARVCLVILGFYSVVLRMHRHAAQLLLGLWVILVPGLRTVLKPPYPDAQNDDCHDNNAYYNISCHNRSNPPSLL